MALEVAAILDESVLNPNWSETSCATLNNSLSKVKVKPGYSILVTIAERSYLLTSNARGILSVTIVRQGPAKAMARAQCRLVVHADALGKFEQQADILQMIGKRKVQFEGDTMQLKNFDTDISPHMNMLRETVEAAGPGSHVLKAAIEEHNRVLDDQEMQLKAYDPDQSQLAVPGEYFVDEQPLIMTLRSWLLFSATSTMSGNTGQANYCAANSVLDALTFSMRTTNGHNNFEPITLMWGAVGGLGMRWKAFASQDFLAQVEYDVLMSADEARQGLTYLVNGLACEWTAFQKFPKHPDLTWLDSMLMMLGNPNERKKDPWKWGKGKGGGLTMDESTDVCFHNTPISKEKEGTAKESWLFPGRRVRIHGLSTHADWNDLKGTLVEEVKPRVWHVRLDDGMGEKLLKVENMTQVHSSVAKPQPAADITAVQATPDVLPTPMCIAGNWNDWIPQDMQWDADGKCYTFNATLGLSGASYFGVNRGEAGVKPWKTGSFKKWCMGHVNGHYQIKVFVKDCKVSEVKWEPRARA